MEITGNIRQIGATQTFGEKGFKKREIVVTTEEQFAQHLLIEFVQDKCSILDRYEVGQNVTVGINLRGREWINPQGEPKYFNTVQGWRITSNHKPSEEVKNTTVNNPQFEPAPALNEEDTEDGLPF